ncbi:MAG: CDP-alcohol phosphatidyltransferase family protein [Myxococcota bacterium]
MTLLSTLCCAASFVLASVASDSLPAMLAAAALVFAYMSLDNMDGAQARRTGTSSRLGEFLDHWLDTLNNGFVVLGACFAVNLGPLLTLLVFSAATLAFFGVQLELRHTGVFRMGRIADIEGNSAVSLLYVTIAFLGRDFFAAEPVSGMPSLAVLIGLGVMGQALWTLGAAAWRLRGSGADFLPIGLSSALLIVWYLQGSVTPAAALTMAFFINPVFTSRPILARLLARSTSTGDWITVAALAVGICFAIFQGTPAAAWGVVLIMAAITVSHAVRTISALLEEADPSRGS